MTGLLLGLAVGGSLLNVGAGFYNAARLKRAAQSNYENQIENIVQQRESGLDQIEQFNRQGEAFLGSGRVANATSGTGGASSSLVLASSRANLTKDARRMQEQLSYNTKAAIKQAKVNLMAGNTASTTSALQATGSLLSMPGQIYSMGHSWGKW